MKNKTSGQEDEKREQMGSTDQIEQRAADLTTQEGRERITDKDREKALQQMHETSPLKKSPEREK